MNTRQKQPETTTEAPPRREDPLLPWIGGGLDPEERLKYTIARR